MDDYGPDNDLQPERSSANEHSSLASLMQNHLDSVAKKIDLPTIPPNGSNLMSFANQFLANRLSTSPSNGVFPSDGRFIIPDLTNLLKGSGNSGLENLVSKLQIKKDESNDEQSVKEEIKSVPKEDEQDDDWVIDLSDAIIKTDISTKPKPAMQITEETISIEFIGCDNDVITLPAADTKPLLPCLLYDCKLSRPRKRRSTHKLSTIGKVICMTPKALEIPRIDLKFYNALNVKVFKFDSPSPDEVILNNLKNKKGGNKRTFLEP